MKQAPATPIAEQKEELGGKTWDPGWDALVEKALPPEMLSGKAAHAVAGYCPKFARETEADKRAFWAYVFQALAGAEAGLDPTINVHHTEAAVARMDGTSKRPIRQEGLLQLAYEDADRYHCSFDWERDRKLSRENPDRTILQPANNLGCGVKIMEKQIIAQGKPLISRTSYWSTLQPGTKSYQVFTKQMANVPAACGKESSSRGPDAKLVPPSKTSRSTLPSPLHDAGGASTLRGCCHARSGTKQVCVRAACARQREVNRQEPTAW